MSKTGFGQSWDWVWLYYCATVMLGFDERQFWRLTPRKLSVLIDKYREINGLSEEQANAEAFEQLMRP